MCPQGNPVSVHVLQTMVLYECEKHGREEEWEEAHVGDRISGILMQLISCLQVKAYRVLGNCGPKVCAYCSKNVSASDL